MKKYSEYKLAEGLEAPWSNTGYQLESFDDDIVVGTILGYTIKYKDLEFNSGDRGLRNIRPVPIELKVIDGTVHWRQC